MAESPMNPNYIYTDQYQETDSREENLNILEDFGEFLNEYEDTARECLKIKKNTINELQDCFRTDQKTLWNNFTQNLTSNQKIIIKNALSDDSDKEKVSNRDLNERRAYEHLSAKYSHLDNSLEEQNPMMGQTMNSKFEKESIHSHQAKFSSSVGFRDAKPPFRDRSQGRRDYFMRSPTSNAEKIEEDNHKYINIIKTLFSNYHKISQKTSEKLGFTQELIYQNEEHLVDLVENTDRFLKDLQEAGFQPELPVFENKSDLIHSQRNETKKIIQELDGMLEQYGDYPGRRRFLTPNQPYRTFNSAKAQRRGSAIEQQMSMEKESALIDKINNLHHQLQSKESETAQRYDSTIKQLERKIRAEVKSSKDHQNKYNRLVEASSDFQVALKDLQKAVRGKKYNISSYKKIFEQKSKNLTNELLKNRNKIMASTAYQKDFYATYNTVLSSRGASPKTNPRVNSEQRVNPKNLNRVYYSNETTDKDDEIEKLVKKVSKLTKQIENYKQKAKEVSKERNILQELCMEKDAMLKEKIKSRHKDSNQDDSFSDGESGLLEVYKTRLNKAEQEVSDLKKEIRKQKENTKEITLSAEASENTHKEKLKELKIEAEEMIEDTQKSLEGQIRTITARLGEKEKRLERVIKEVRQRMETIESGKSSIANQTYEAEINTLTEKHQREINSLKEKLGNANVLEKQLEEMQENQHEIESLKQTLQSKTNLIEKLTQDIADKNTEINELSDKLIEEQRSRSKEIKDLKIELSETLKLEEENQQLDAKIESLKEQIKDIRARTSDEINEITQEKDEIITQLHTEVSSLKKDLRKETQAQKLKEDELSEKLRIELEEGFSKIEEDLKQKIKAQKDVEATHLSQIEELTYHNESYESKLQEAERKYKLKLSDLEQKLSLKSSDYDELCETLEAQRQEYTQNSTQKEKLLENDLEKSKQELKDITESYKQREKEFDQQLKQIREEMAQSVSEVKTENIEFSSQLREKDDELLELTTIISEKDREITRLQNKLEEEKKQISDVYTKRQSEELGAVKNTHQKQISDLMQKLADAKTEFDELSNEKDATDTEVKDLRKNASKLQKEVERLISSNDQITLSLSEAQEELSQCQQNSDSSLSTIKSLRKDLKDAQMANTELQNEAVVSAEKITKLESEIILLNSKINSLKNTLQVAQDQNKFNKDLEEEKNELSLKCVKLDKEHRRLQTELDKKELEETMNKRLIQDQEIENKQLKDDLNQLSQMLASSDTDTKVSDSLKKFMEDAKRKEDHIEQLQVDFRKEREQFNTTIQKLKSEFRDKEDQVEELTNEIRHLNESLSKEKKNLNAQIVQLQNELEEANDELTRSSTDQTGAEAKYTSLKKDHLALKKSFEEQSVLLEDAQDMKHGVETKLNALKTSITKKDAEIDTKKLEIRNLESKIKDLKSDLDDYEDTNNSLSDDLTKSRVENGELKHKISRLEEAKKALEDAREQDDSTELISTMGDKINELEDENRKLRATVNDLNEAQSKLETEIGQYKLNLERIKKEQAKEKEQQTIEKEQAIGEASDLLEQFNAEKHLYKAKIKKLLIEYCDYNENSYNMSDEEATLDDFYEILEKELKLFTERIKEESLDRINKIALDLETAQKQQTSVEENLEKAEKENIELLEEKKDLTFVNGELKEQNSNLKIEIEALESKIQDLEQRNELLSSNLTNLNSQRSNEESSLQELEQKVSTLTIDNKSLSSKVNKLEQQLAEKESDLKEKSKMVDTKQEEIAQKNKNIEEKLDKIESLREIIERMEDDIDTLKEELREAKEAEKAALETNHQEASQNEDTTKELKAEIKNLLKEIDELQEEKIEINEKLKFTEKELKDAQDKIIESKNLAGANNAPESSRDTEEGKEFIERMDVVERRVDEIKHSIGEMKVQAFDELKEQYEQDYKQFIKSCEKKIIQKNIDEKGKIAVLKELKGSMNDSIRVLKCVTHESQVWFLIEEDIDDQEVDIPQYWIREVDLTAEEKEYLHDFLPQSMREEDITENQQINKIVSDYSDKLTDLRLERLELLKECREIRFGHKISYFCLNESFDEEAEEKLQEYDIKIIEYEDDINNLQENMQNSKLEINDLQISNRKLAKRVEELNSIIGNISHGTNETVENFLKNYQKTNDLMYKNKELMEELSNKNDEIESLKNSSAPGKDFLSEKEEYKSNASREGSSRPEFDVQDLSLGGSNKNRTIDKSDDTFDLRSKVSKLEEDNLDLKKLNNIIMGQNQKLKDEIKELDAQKFNNTNINDSKETEPEKGEKEIEHIKDILIKFLKETPLTNKNNEMLLLTVFSMLYLNKLQIDEIQQCRRLITAQYEDDIKKNRGARSTSGSKPRKGFWNRLRNKK
ncbi:unnamed protein product [Moneuplotes crassus]|uniref:Uncharacterized protein n=1 Tax=Euplotes crassus TaxID=5936 RepID=A0AAD2CXA2_EUPCR|nr:unnamed protein product [Moneuplotes crassus]